MQKIIWQPSYSVGVKLIDTQHKKLFSILNDLQDGLDDDPALLEKTIYDLKAYVEFHFGEEEKYFKKFNYADAPSHIEQHHIYIEKINELHERFLKRESDVGAQILDFLNRWILEHVQVIDKKYGRCFNDHGLS
jgi:hemerythrin-like metal-binding protein